MMVFFFQDISMYLQMYRWAHTNIVVQGLWTQKTVLLFVITFDHIDSTKGPHPVWKMSCYEEENILLLEKIASKVFKTLIDILPCLFYSHVEKKVSTGLYAVCTKNIVKLLSE